MVEVNGFTEESNVSEASDHGVPEESVRFGCGGEEGESLVHLAGVGEEGDWTSKQ